jgi:formamidopyrimidine-DNA glycosylase
MPEGVEIEIYRRAAEAVIGRRVADVHAPDQWFLKSGTTADELVAVARGAAVVAARRKGKLLVLDLDTDHRLGLRFGMTGRLLVDGGAAIEQLEYSSTRDDPAWDRFALIFADGGRLIIRDPRRLGGVELDPDEDRLGFDVFSITPGQLRQRVTVGDVAIKARLLDQQRISGVGNLIADESLWRAGIDPARPAGTLSDNDRRRLQRHLRSVVEEFLDDGGSHTGRLHQARVRGGRCPRDGEILLRRTIGGRTTYSCPDHQT